MSIEKVLTVRTFSILRFPHRYLSSHSDTQVPTSEYRKVRTFSILSYGHHKFPHLERCGNLSDTQVTTSIPKPPSDTKVPTFSKIPTFYDTMWELFGSTLGLKSYLKKKYSIQKSIVKKKIWLTIYNTKILDLKYLGDNCRTCVLGAFNVFYH